MKIKGLFVAILLLAIALPQMAGAQTERKYIRQGNRQFNSAFADSTRVDSARFADAEASYRKALEEDPNSWDASFNLANAMMSQGRMDEAARQLHLLREEPSARLLGCALKSLKVFGNGKCASMRITARDYRECRALPEHNSSIVNYALNIPGVEAIFLAEERESGEVKASPKPIKYYINNGCGCCQGTRPCTNQIALNTSIQVTAGA